MSDIEKELIAAQNELIDSLKIIISLLENKILLMEELYKLKEKEQEFLSNVYLKSVGVT